MVWFLDFLKAVLACLLIVWMSSGVYDLIVGLLRTQRLADVSCHTTAGELLIVAKYGIVFFLCKPLLLPYLKTIWASLQRTVSSTLSF